MEPYRLRILTFLTVIGLLVSPLFAAAQATQSCIILNRNLSFGSRGIDVTALQQFLVGQKLLPLSSDSVTGYFGRLTREAVTTFQSQENLPAMGLVGPLTRAAIKRTCSGNTLGSSYIYASPTFGYAPLAVTFKTFPPEPPNFPQANSGSTSETSEDFKIDFGDGQSSSLPTTTDCQVLTQVKEPYCGVRTASHMYVSSGTYTAKLMQSFQGAYRSIGTVMISVTNQ